MGQQPCSGLLALGDLVRRSRGGRGIWACRSACVAVLVIVSRLLQRLLQCLRSGFSGCGCYFRRRPEGRGCQRLSNWCAISAPRRCLSRFGKGPVHSHPPHFIIFLPADLPTHLLSSFKPFILVFVCVCVLYPASKPVILLFILLLPVCFLFVSYLPAYHSHSPFSASTPKQPNAKPPQ